MRNIQEVSSEILNNVPKTLYILSGSEYGIKDKYITQLTSFYTNKVEVNSMSTFMSSFSVKRLFDVTKSVFVSRYDTEFLSSLTEDIAKKLTHLHIPGTLVMIFDDKESVQTKLEKYFSDFHVVVPNVDTKFVHRYIKSDFPELADESIAIACAVGQDYYSSKNIARCLSMLPSIDVVTKDVSYFQHIFGANVEVTDKDVRLGLAARNFTYLLNVIENYPNDLSYFLYSMLNTLIELEKLCTNSYAESDIRKYAKNWTLPDIYNMFNNIYNELQLTRSISTITTDRLVYLISLLQFKQIPYMEAI